MHTKQNNRRRHPRLAINIKACLQMPDGRRFEGCTQDISMGGLYLKSNDISSVYENLPAEGEEGMAILLYSNDNDDVITARLPCRMAHANTRGAGITFAAITLEDETKLHELISAYIVENQKIGLHGYERFPMTADCVLSIETKTFHGSLNNISFGGTSVQFETTELEKHVGKLGALRIDITMTGQSFELTTQCRVLHAMQNNAGLCFEAIDEANAKKLHTIVCEAHRLDFEYKAQT